MRSRQTRFTGFDDKIISMYARGMSTREIAGHLQETRPVARSAWLRPAAWMAERWSPRKPFLLVLCRAFLNWPYNIFIARL
jgi:hypothetical protein